MTDPPRLNVLIVGFGVSKRVKALLTTKTAIARYLATWSETCDVTWAPGFTVGQVAYEGSVPSSVETIEIGNNLLVNAVRLRAMLTTVRSKHSCAFDIVVAAYPTAINLLPIIANRRLARLLVVYVGNDFTLPLTVSNCSSFIRHRIGALWRTVAMTLILRRSDVIIARGSSLCAKLQHFKKPVHETVPITQLEAGSISAPDTYQNNGRYFLYVGGLSEEKGVDVLIDGYRSAHSKDPTVPSLKLAGTGPLEEQVKAMALDGVEVLGFVDNEQALAELFSNALALIVPSRPWGEGVPRVIEEAIACGTDVWSSPLPTIFEEYGNYIHFFKNSPPTREEIENMVIATSKSPATKRSPRTRLIGATRAAHQHIAICTSALYAKTHTGS